MLTVFIEYKVKEEQREAYLQEMSRIPQQVAERGGRGYRFYEGLDQPCLFVESFEVEDETVYQAIKAWRTGDRRFAPYLAGGLEKMHVWAFQPVALGRS
ncbi:antibiotic biosynthesis monooxygenase [Brevibacillus marinus]|uniref:antibiotic biosynthesis monooxygenase n=1 Tax=Brevibacillus marinus TaxID=2496837 RepID=UPI000F836C7B|nr:antibiotic biosynthesis monooxygenase [Brevibacillus marinus]